MRAPSTTELISGPTKCPPYGVYELVLLTKDAAFPSGYYHSVFYDNLYAARSAAHEIRSKEVSHV